MGSIVASILAEVSRVGLADQLIELIKTCADCDTVKGIIGIAGVAQAAPLLVPAAVLVGMELFKAKGERNEEGEFESHCKEVIGLLGGLSGRTDAVAEQLDGLITHRTWVWARFSGGDQAAFAKRVRGEIHKDLAAIGIDIRDDLEGLRIYSATIIATQGEHSAALADNSAARARIEKLLIAERQANPNSPPALSPDDQRILDEVKQSTDLLMQLGARVLQPDSGIDGDLALLRRKHEANEYELCMLEGKRWYFARPVPQFDRAIPFFDRAMHLNRDSLDARNYAATSRNSARLGDITVHQMRAIHIYEGTLKLVPHRSSDWAGTQNNLGNSWQNLPTGDRTKNLENAIACYRLALEVRTKADLPANWATTQNNLGNAWGYLPTGDRTTNLENAIACYRLALEVCTKADFPAHWATTQNNLGNAWWNLPTGDRTKNLENAIACYRLALEVYTKADFPADWAGTQNNLGNAWWNLPTGDRTKNFENAIACYRLALEVYTKADFPTYWAGTQNNFGNSWQSLPTGDRTTNLETAIDCCRLALEVYTKTGFPTEWATTQNNLGNAWGQLPTGDRAKNLESAIACYRLALEVRTRAGFPTERATTQNNLGNAWGQLPTGDRAKNLESAIACYRLALEVRTKADLPTDWATTQNNLGVALAALADQPNLPAGQDRCGLLRRAIACSKGALTIRTAEAFPRDRADTMKNMNIDRRAYEEAGGAEKVPFDDIPPAE